MGCVPGTPVVCIPGMPPDRCARCQYWIAGLDPVQCSAVWVDWTYPMRRDSLIAWRGNDEEGTAS